MSDAALLWMLNQYRSAELRGADVILRLARQAGSTSMQTSLTRHLRDEGRHAHSWTRAIVELGGTPADVADPYQARLSSVFGRPRTLNELLVVTLITERRGLAQYEEHLAQADVPRPVERRLRSIIGDERWHVSWIDEELRARSRTDHSIPDAVERAEAADAAAIASIHADAAVVGQS